MERIFNTYFLSIIILWVSLFSHLKNIYWASVLYKYYVCCSTCKTRQILYLLRLLKTGFYKSRKTFSDKNKARSLQKKGLPSMSVPTGFPLHTVSSSMLFLDDAKKIIDWWTDNSKLGTWLYPGIKYIQGPSNYWLAYTEKDSQQALCIWKDT